MFKIHLKKVFQVLHSNNLTTIIFEKYKKSVQIILKTIKVINFNLIKYLYTIFQTKAPLFKITCPPTNVL